MASPSWRMLHSPFFRAFPFTKVPKVDESLMKTRRMTSPSCAPLRLHARNWSKAWFFEIFLSFRGIWLFSALPTETEEFTWLKAISGGTVWGAPSVRTKTATGEPSSIRLKAGLAPAALQNCFKGDHGNELLLVVFFLLTIEIWYIYWWGDQLVTRRWTYLVHFFALDSVGLLNACLPAAPWLCNPASSRTEPNKLPIEIAAPTP